MWTAGFVIYISHPLLVFYLSDRIIYYKTIDTIISCDRISNMRTKGAKNKKLKEVECIRCGKVFNSSDGNISRRICRECTGKGNEKRGGRRDMVEERENGKTYREIGRKYGLSRQRIYQIIKREKEGR